MCVYQKCQMLTYLDKDKSDTISSTSCVPICNETNEPNLSQNICKQAIQCSTQYVQPSQINKGRSIKSIFVSNTINQIFLVYAQFINAINQENGSIIRSYVFDSSIFSVYQYKQNIFLFGDQKNSVFLWNPMENILNKVLEIGQGTLKAISQIMELIIQQSPSWQIKVFEVIQQNNQLPVVQITHSYICSCTSSIEQFVYRYPTDQSVFLQTFLLTSNGQIENFTVQITLNEQNQNNLNSVIQRKDSIQSFIQSPSNILLANQFLDSKGNFQTCIRFQRQTMQNQNAVNAVTYSTLSQLIVSCGSDGRVIVWQTVDLAQPIFLYYLQQQGQQQQIYYQGQIATPSSVYLVQFFLNSNYQLIIVDSTNTIFQYKLADGTSVSFGQDQSINAFISPSQITSIFYLPQQNGSSGQNVVSSYGNTLKNLVLAGFQTGQVRLIVLDKSVTLQSIYTPSSPSDNIQSIQSSFQIGIYFIVTSYQIQCFSIYTDKLIEILSFKTLNSTPLQPAIQNIIVSNNLKILISYIKTEIILKNFNNNLLYSAELSLRSIILVKLVNGIYIDDNQQQIYIYGSDIPTQVRFQFIVDAGFKQIIIYKQFIDVYSFQGIFIQTINTVTASIIYLKQTANSIVVFNLSNGYIFYRGDFITQGSIQPSGGFILGVYYIESINQIAFFTNQILFGQVLFYNLNNQQSAGFVSNTYKKNSIGRTVQVSFDSDSVMLNYSDNYGNFQNVIFSTQKTADNQIVIPQILNSKVQQPQGYLLDFDQNSVYIYGSDSLFKINKNILTRPIQENIGINFHNLTQNVTFQDINISNQIIPSQTSLIFENKNMVIIKNLTIQNTSFTIQNLEVNKQNQNATLSFLNIKQCQYIYENQLNLVNIRLSNPQQYILNIQNSNQVFIQNVNIMNSKILGCLSQITNNQSFQNSFSTVSLSQIQNNYIFTFIGINNLLIDNIKKLKLSQNQDNCYFYTSSSVQIQDSIFDQNQGVLGGSISFESIQQSIFIKNSNFTSNKALSSGGTIIISDSNQIKVDQSYFISNQAKILGAIRIISSQLKTKEQQLKTEIFNCNFSLNQAQIYGNNIGRYPSFIEIYIQRQNENILLDQQPIQTITNENVLNIKELQSGGLVPIKIKLLDDDMNEFRLQTELVMNNKYPQSIQNELSQYFLEVTEISSVQLVNQTQNSTQQSINTSADVEGQTLVTSIQFNQEFNSFSFSTLSISYVPKKTTDSLVIKFTMSNKFTSMMIPLNLSFLECIKGEIFVKSSKIITTCQECQEGTYSLINPNQIDNSADLQCKTCPLSAKNCSKDQIILESGYWRIINSSDNIIECNANNPNICDEADRESYIGPLCETCDIGGYVWGGERYTNSFANFQYNQCSSITYQALLIGLTFVILLFLSIILFMNSYIYDSTCCYLRLMSILPLSKSSIKDESTFFIKALVNYLQLSACLFKFQISFLPQIVAVIPSFAGLPVTVQVRQGALSKLSQNDDSQIKQFQESEKQQQKDKIKSSIISKKAFQTEFNSPVASFYRMGNDTQTQKFQIDYTKGTLNDQIILGCKDPFAEQDKIEKSRILDKLKQDLKQSEDDCFEKNKKEQIKLNFNLKENLTFKQLQKSVYPSQESQNIEEGEFEEDIVFQEVFEADHLKKFKTLFKNKSKEGTKD
ncbi:hypothetical protein ABPG72_012918 [Tetrahymena utriculariae]